MVVDVGEITVAHSPDSDDAFMFYALAGDLMDTGGLKIKQVQKDIQTLNQEALEGKYDVTAISFAAYPYIQDKYILMPCGASMGENYGPVVVAKKALTVEDLKSARIAIPGEMTSAYLALRLMVPGITGEAVYFEDIPEKVASGEYDAGLLIHEGQLTYGESGLKKVVDMGEWWHELHGLPLPLGSNAIRRDLGPELIARVTRVIRDSIQYSLDHREAALKYAMDFAKDMKIDLADKYVGMYVNEMTVDFGEAGRRSVEKFFAMANDLKLFDRTVTPEFAPSPDSL